MRKTKEVARFEVGDIVDATGFDKFSLKISRVYHNGFTYMYGFEDEAMACGEMYLSPARKQDRVIHTENYIKKVGNLVLD